jgi:hypothetical protein
VVGVDKLFDSKCLENHLDECGDPASNLCHWSTQQETVAVS